MSLKSSLAVVLLLAGLGLAGCETQDENDVAKAQKCLDGLGSNPTPTAAQSCLNPIANLYSPAAYTIRCSVDFIVGGITDASIVAAYNNIQNKTGNQLVTYLAGALAQKDLNGEYTAQAESDAQTTLSDCQNSGVASLTYLAGISLTGTILVATEAIANGQGSIDTTNASTFISTCQANPASCNPSAIGSAAQTVDSSYCTGSSASTSICQSLATAISSGNGDPTAIGTAIIGLLQQ